MDYIIVQAGGKGKRLGDLTKNKPKALVPVENMPILFHLFRKFPDKHFIIIADYKKDVLKKYLKIFAEVKYQIIDAKGTGTVSGIQEALKLVPNKEPFMLIWSDLVLPDMLDMRQEGIYGDGLQPLNYIGISETFLCRWKYENGIFSEEASMEHGVAGLFIFNEKACISDVPCEGEFVRYLQGKEMCFKEIGLAGTREFGCLEEYEKLSRAKCRPFNRVMIQGEIFVKEAIDQQGKELAVRECAWYKKAEKLQINSVPAIYNTDPLQIELIHGKNVHECLLQYNDKLCILHKIIKMLHALHESEHIPTDYVSLKEAYYDKTMRRLKKVKALLPFHDQKMIWINGKKCRNIFYCEKELENAIENLSCKNFSFIHGDCTFSNIMIRDGGIPVLIDPRGYFGFTEFFGDERYDWAKLYYSIVGNYDQFNLGNFNLVIGEKEVSLAVKSNGWEKFEDVFFELTHANKKEIKLLHSIIWLSLTTYAWEDYDSICGAFYNGLYYLQDVL